MNRILLIEDEGRIAELIKKSLEEQAYSVTIALDSLAGKQLAVANDFDLIITAIILPGLNGIALCKEIRSLKPVIPTIMLTALGTTDDKVDGFDAGARRLFLTTDGSGMTTVSNLTPGRYYVKAV